MINKEIQNRIRLSVAAFSYEYQSDSIMSDAEFDALAKQINPKESTGNDVMDRFFREQFEPDTGMWIHNHPNLRGLEIIYNKYYKGF
jgi:hypothetical protein